MSTNTSTQPETLLLFGKGGPNDRELADAYLLAPQGYLVRFEINAAGKRSPKRHLTGKVISLEREFSEVNYRIVLGRHVTVKLVVHTTAAGAGLFPGDIISNWYDPYLRESHITVHRKMF